MAGDAAVFRSKVDVWVVLVLVGALGVGAWAGFRALQSDPPVGWLVTVSLGIAWVVVGSVTVPMRYVLSDTELVIRAGVTRIRIPYDRIRGVQKTRSPWAGPAWSLDRLRIDYSPGRAALISPVRQNDFLVELERRTGVGLPSAMCDPAPLP